MKSLTVDFVNVEAGLICNAIAQSDTDISTKLRLAIAAGAVINNGCVNVDAFVIEAKKWNDRGATDGRTEKLLKPILHTAFVANATKGLDALFA